MTYYRPAVDVTVHPRHVRGYSKGQGMTFTCSQAIVLITVLLCIYISDINRLLLT